MRHPIVLAMVVALWSTPVMTIDRFILALGFTIYPLVSNHIDEQDVQYVEDQLTQEIIKVIQKKPK